MRLLGCYDDFADAETKLREILTSARQQNRQVGRATTEPYVRRMLPFNHALRDIIDSNRGLKPEQLAQFLYIARKQLAGKLAADSMGKGPIKLVYGMANEVVAEDALFHVNGVADVIPASVEEELRGIDLTAIGENGASQAFDVKSTERGMSIARSRSGRNPHSIAVWTGLNPDHFSKGFQLDDRTIRTVVRRFMPHLEEVLG